MLNHFLIKFKGRIRIYSSDEDNLWAYPSLTTTMLMPLLGTMVRHFDDYNIFSYTYAWIASSILIIPALMVYVITNRKEIQKSWAKVLGVIFLGGLYFIGVMTQVSMLNCLFDRSDPHIFQVEVLDKEIDDSGDYTDYELYIQPWTDSPDEEVTVKVSKSMYQKIQIGDFVNIHEKEGLLNIPWFYVKK